MFRPRLLFSVHFLGAFLSPDIIYHYWSLDLLNSRWCFVLNQDLALAQTPLFLFSRHWSRRAPQDMLDSPSLLPGVMHSDLGAHAFLLAGLSYCPNSTWRTSQDYGYTVSIGPHLWWSQGIERGSWKPQWQCWQPDLHPFEGGFSAPQFTPGIPGCSNLYKSLYQSLSSYSLTHIVDNILALRIRPLSCPNHSAVHSSILFLESLLLRC